MLDSGYLYIILTSLSTPYIIINYQTFHTPSVDNCGYKFAVMKLHFQVVMFTGLIIYIQLLMWVKKKVNQCVCFIYSFDLWNYDIVCLHHQMATRLKISALEEWASTSVTDKLRQYEWRRNKNKSRQKLYPIPSSFILFMSKHQLHYSLPFSW